MASRFTTHYRLPGESRGPGATRPTYPPYLTVQRRSNSLWPLGPGLRRESNIGLSKQKMGLAHVR